jgi:hypothetical protein
LTQNDRRYEWQDILKPSKFIPCCGVVSLSGKWMIWNYAQFAFRLSLFQRPELLGRDIMLSDFDDEHDLLGLRLGIFQLLKRCVARTEICAGRS